ncbi:MAG: hypothetical protein AAF664_17040 [Planctomycetota bacterium]
MKLYSFSRLQGNFGDDLSPWLYSRLIPELDKLENADWLVGIGTILDKRLDGVPGSKIICGAGVRIGKWDYIPRHNWKIIALRGKLSAQKLGVEMSLACSDPGVLVAEFFERKRSSQETVGFIPHYHSMAMFNCESIAERSGCMLIRPDASVEVFMDKLSVCDRIVSEAMHGAIAADAIGIPWKRINILSWRKETREVSDFKWRDWASQFEVEADPSEVVGVKLISHPRLRRLNRFLKAGNEASIGNAVMRCAKSTGFKSSSDLIRADRSGDLLRRIEGICRKGGAVFGHGFERGKA